MAILRATQSCALPVALLLLLFAALLLLVAVLPLLALLGRWRLAAVGRATTLALSPRGRRRRSAPLRLLRLLLRLALLHLDGNPLHLPAPRHHHRLRRRPALRSRNFFHRVHDRHAVHDAAKDDVFAVKVLCLAEGDEELGAVGVLARVGHREHARRVVPQREVALVLELSAEDGLAAGAVAVRKIAALHHEALDDAVEEGVAEVQRLAGALAQAALAGAQAAKVLDRARHHIGKQLDHDPACPLAADLEVEKDARVEALWVDGVGVLGVREELTRALGGGRGGGVHDGHREELRWRESA
mmetsp:Transcript_25997/g.83641  ORF Transcript_25997/g.83641 Transcript_25997/m.83641 type:complete len:300 (-) Transcript_25997:28-927(-)